jgi:hypothetical protein
MPPFVLDIRGNMIVFEGSVDRVLPALRSSVYAADLCTDSLGHVCLSFPNEPKDLFHNIPFMERLFFCTSLAFYSARTTNY